MSVETVFAAAAMKPPAERADYLNEACAGDAEFRRKVERLLKAHAAAGEFLEAPAERLVGTVDYAPITEKPGSKIGPYVLREQIGEGGFGLVFVAEQTEPIKRKVALKIIKPGMDSAQVIARFEAERQALALMDHPNIARVLDAGATESGRPYFVMELVRGIPITEYCDKNQLAPKERLELFVTVCQAIQHAHQKGIIHRDVKPSNVLVTSHDGKPVAKVIDFGVAKAIHQHLTERTIYTNFAQMIGTPLYMSPEQAEMSGLDIDTRSDIYSLGVLLYELLTGSTPLEKKRFAQAAYDEIRRMIREDEPPKPSARLSELDQVGRPSRPSEEPGRAGSPSHQSSLASIAAQRHMEPAKLSKLVRGDLDWITMKALEKDRSRRYETANGLARDIQRYLADEPVEACPPSATYRLRKFARKNRAALTTAAAIALLLIAGLGVSLWQMSRAIDAEAQAKANEGKAIAERERAVKAEAQANQESDAKGKALEAEQKARQQAFAALRSMTDEVVERKFAAGQGYTLTDEDRAFLRGVIAQYEAFAVIGGEDADSRAVRAEGRGRVGLMRYRLGELKEAEADYNAALGIRKQLAADFPTRPDFRRSLATSHNNRGLLLRDTGRPKEAAADYDAALGIYKQLSADFPTRPDFRRELAASHNNRGNLLRDTSRPKEAEADYAAALGIYKQLSADFPTHPDFRRELAASHNNRGNLLRDTSRPKEAEADYAAALGILKQLSADFPTRPDFRQALAGGHNNLGALRYDTGQPKEAQADYDAALGIFKQLAADFPTRPQFRLDLARGYHNKGLLLSEMGRPKEAEADYAAALRIQKQLAAEFPDQPDVRNDLAGAYVNLALLQAQRKDWAAAKRSLEEGRPHHLAALKANPRDPTYRRFYGNHLFALTPVHAGLLEPAEAVRTAEARRDLGWDPLEDAFDAACLLSLCIPIVEAHDKLDDTQRKEAVEFYAAQAMKLLREAVSKGYQGTRGANATPLAEQLKKDPDLAPLRGREDFQKLVAELEVKGK